MGNLFLCWCGKCACQNIKNDLYWYYTEVAVLLLWRCHVATLNTVAVQVPYSRVKAQEQHTYFCIAPVQLLTNTASWVIII